MILAIIKQPQTGFRFNLKKKKSFPSSLISLSLQVVAALAHLKPKRGNFNKTDPGLWKN